MTFEKVDLGNVCTFFNNSRKPVTRSSRVAGEYRYFGAAGIQDYVSEYLFDGDFILVGEDGTVITDDDRPVVQQVSGKFWVNNHAHVIQPNEMQDYDYLYFAISSAKVRDLVTGAVQPKLSMTNLKQLQIPWATDSVVRLKIGSILRNLDAKISANEALSKTLKDIAQTIFKSWFIDFDPVKAKMAGEKPAGMDAATAALFPESMEESELGLIPKDWEIATIGNTLDVGGGTTPSTANSAYWDGEHCWTTPKDLSSQVGIITIDSTRKITDLGLAEISSGLLPINSVLMSCRAPIGYVSINAVPTAVNQGFITMRYSDEFHPLYVLNWLNANMHEIHNRAGGATFAEITRKAFRDIPFLKPASIVMKKYAQIAEPILKQLEQLTRQTKNLQVVRDLMLPRLISGELQIPKEMLAS